MNTLSLSSLALSAMVAIALPAPAAGQDRTQPTTASAPRPEPHRIGVEGFGGAAMTWQTAKDSFEAAGLDVRTVEFGGGGRVTGIWRNLYAEVAASRWSDTGERVFIDSDGNRFPLGIPLNVKATYVDMTVGWKGPIPAQQGGTRAIPYVGGGAGWVTYKESSPFAEAGGDIDTRSPSYHVLLGVDFPLLTWLGVAVDGRYRYVPDVLGEDGVSAALGEDTLGGFQTSVSLRVGFGGPRARLRQPERRTPVQTPATEPPGAPPLPTRLEDVSGAVILATAPVYLLPDQTRTPLRELPAGTAVRLLEQAGDWVRIQFNDPQFGPRVGYVLRKFVDIGKR